MKNLENLDIRDRSGFDSKESRLYSQYKKLLRATFVRTPIRAILPSLLAGQVLVWLEVASVGLAAIILMFSLSSRISRPLRLVGLSWIIVGSLSMLALGPSSREYGLSNGRSYIAVVDEEPRRRRVGGVELSLIIESELAPELTAQFTVQQRVLCKAVELPWKNIKRAEKGDRYVIRANFRMIKKRLNPFDYESKLYRDGYSATCKIRYASQALSTTPTTLSVFRNFLFDRVRAVVREPRNAGLFLSMAFGVRDVLSDSVERAYKVAGLSHLLVFSGAQVMLVYYFVFALCRLFLRLTFHGASSAWFFLSLWCPLKRVFSVLALLAALFCCLIAGFEVSAVRAAISALFLVLGNILERPTALLDSILSSLFVLALIWPGCYFEPGVQLTYAALFGIYFANRRGGASLLVRYFSTSLLAWLFTTPVCLLWFGQFALLGLPFNLLFAAPLAFFSCNFGYVALLLNLCGVDRSGYLLNFCADVLGWLNSAVLWLVQLVQ